MFTKALCVALLTVSLSSFAVQAAPARQQPQSCDAASVSTVVQTVTVTARGAAQTNAGANNNSAKGGKNNANTKGGKGSNNQASGGNAKGNNNAGQAASASASAKGAAKTDAANAGKGGNNANAGKGGNNNNAAGNNGGDAQTSLTLDPKVIAAGFANDGQDVPAAGQVKSLTSTNNFINFCLTVPNLPITNGKQITTGSCNPAPIGTIPSVDNMPSSKFVFPQNFGTIQANKAFTIKMAIKNMQTGFFVNAQANYFSAPQFLNAQGQIQGHSHVVVEQISALDQTTPTDPKKFAFFKGLNAAASNGQLTADVTAGLPAGVYKLSSINSAANHQPVIVPVAQHGSLDDAVYFTVTDDGKPAAGAANNATGAAANNGKGAAAAAAGNGGNNNAKGANNNGKGAAAAGNGGNNNAKGANNNAKGANNQQGNGKAKGN